MNKEQALVVFENYRIRRIYDEKSEAWFFSVVDIVAALLLQKDRRGGLIHVVWGIPKSSLSPAVLVTAYRPDPTRWEEDFRRRRK